MSQLILQQAVSGILQAILWKISAYLCSNYALVKIFKQHSAYESIEIIVLSIILDAICKATHPNICNCALYCYYSEITINLTSNLIASSNVCKLKLNVYKHSFYIHTSSLFIILYLIALWLFSSMDTLQYSYILTSLIYGCFLTISSNVCNSFIVSFSLIIFGILSLFVIIVFAVYDSYIV